MKKSELKKTIRESIKELMNEQLNPNTPLPTVQHYNYGGETRILVMCPTGYQFSDASLSHAPQYVDIIYECVPTAPADTPVSKLGVGGALSGAGGIEDPRGVNVADPRSAPRT